MVLNRTGGECAESAGALAGDQAADRGLVFCLWDRGVCAWEWNWFLFCGFAQPMFHSTRDLCNVSAITPKTHVFAKGITTRDFRLLEQLSQLWQHKPCWRVRSGWPGGCGGIMPAGISAPYGTRRTSIAKQTPEQNTRSSFHQMCPSLLLQSASVCCGGCTRVLC